MTAWPNSILVSLDGVAIDSVGLDFLTSEWPDRRDSSVTFEFRFQRPAEELNGVQRKVAKRSADQPTWNNSIPCAFPRLPEYLLSVPLFQCSCTPRLRHR